MAGEIKVWRMPKMRGVERRTRRARLLAARTYRPRTIPRQAILGGSWDNGDVVRQHMRDEE